MTRPDSQARDDFDELLAWLGPGRESAGNKYEEIRLGLIRIFDWRGWGDPEGLADETILRVTRRVRELTAKYEGDPAHYFYGVAKNVYKELWRDPTTPLPERADSLLAAPQPEDRGEDERRYQCLDRCLAQLAAADRELIMCYYEGEGQPKIDFRKHLAETRGMTVNTLRVKVYRIRAALQKCINDCLGAAPGEMD